jgi:hypothetical protein
LPKRIGGSATPLRNSQRRANCNAWNRCTNERFRNAQGARKMQFEARFGTVSAANVTLDGVELTVVSAGGRAHCVPADFFALFFQPSSVEPAKVEVARAAKSILPSPRKPEPPLNKPPVKAALGPTEAIFAAIKESAMTTTELTDRALTMMDKNPKDAGDRSRLSASITYLKTNGRIEKRECPVTRLDKWYLASKPPVNGHTEA